MTICGAISASLLFTTAFGACAQQASFETKSLTPESAQSAARAALEHCRKGGYQVAVAVVDRSGVLQAFVRDRYAGVHTVEVAQNKAWTAASFKISTTALAVETQAGKPMSGLRGLSRVIAAGGGRTVEAGGQLLGGIGVSGAPGGEADDACADAGIEAIADELAF